MCKGINRDCKPCKSQNYNAVPLDESIPSAVEDFFRDPLDHLKRFLKVYDFQRNHRDQLLKRQTEQVIFYCYIRAILRYHPFLTAKTGGFTNYPVATNHNRPTKAS